MKTNYIIALCLASLLSFFLSSCNKCAGIACTTPPQEFYFEIYNTQQEHIPIDSLKDRIEIINIASKKSLPLEFNSNGISCRTIGWEIGEENKYYTLRIDDMAFTFIYWTEDRSEECCDIIGDLKEFSSESFVIEKSVGYGYRIKI